MQLLPRGLGSGEIVGALKVDQNHVVQGGLMVGINLERLAVFTDGFIGSAQVVVRRPQVRSRIDVMRVPLQSFLVPRDGLLELLVVVKEMGERTWGRRTTTWAEPIKPSV